MLRFTLNPGNKLFPKDLNAYHMQKKKREKKRENNNYNKVKPMSLWDYYNYSSIIYKYFILQS